jgi:hypothetical protein
MLRYIDSRYHISKVDNILSYAHSAGMMHNQFISLGLLHNFEISATWVQLPCINKFITC